MCEGNKVQIYTLPMKELAELIKLQLSEGGSAQLRVTGCSMLPMLREGRDAVTLVPIVGHLEKGNVILYQRKNGQYILHRIIRAEGGNYICCGDNQFEKELVEHSQAVAVVSAFTHKDRHHACTDWGYRLYTAIWVGLFPLRKFYILMRRKLGRLRRKMQG